MFLSIPAKILTRKNSCIGAGKNLSSGCEFADTLA